MNRYRIFNQSDVVAIGWYWLLPGRDLKRRATRAVNILGFELAIFRGADGSVAALDAYCPHMGAHLSEGKVEGNQLRCFFHNWCFNRQGKCTDIPCLNGAPEISITTTAWHVQEQHGLIWIWLGEGEPFERVPEPPLLLGTAYDCSLGNRFIKSCHPNVVMVNAIDEQHFQTVHHLPGHILSIAPTAKTSTHIAFLNQGTVPTSHLAGKVIKAFYKNRLTYNLDYWYGSTGTVSLGPDFFPLYLMFALRMTVDGKTEGYAVAFTKKRAGLLAGLFSRFVLFITQLAGLYFAKGDTRIFQTIRFDLKTPIAADRAVLAFIQHLEKQECFLKAGQLTNSPPLHSPVLSAK